MAHINSIALGKVHGKLGNVIFQSYKRKVIARQLNMQITSPPSEAQITVRQKLKTSGLAYKYLADFLGDAVGIMKYGENMSSAFTRIIAGAIPEGFPLTPIEAADILYGNTYGAASPFHITKFDLSGSLPEINFIGQGEEFLPLTYVRMISWNVSSGQQKSLVYTLTEEQYVSGIFLCPDDFTNLGAVACYVANGNCQLVSELCFQLVI